MPGKGSSHGKRHEALSARDLARLYPDRITESAARRVLRERVRAGESGFTVDGGPIRVRGVWLATLEWWREALTR